MEPEFAELTPTFEWSDTKDPIDDMPVRVEAFVAPPEEATSNDWWCAAHRFIIDVIERNYRVFDDLGLTRPHISTWQRTITFGAYSLRELKTFMAMLPQPKKWDKASDGSPKLVATVNGWNLELARYDLTCEVVETGEYQEIEVDEVVTPAVKQKVKKQVPVTVTECPPMLMD